MLDWFIFMHHLFCVLRICHASSSRELWSVQSFFYIPRHALIRSFKCYNVIFNLHCFFFSPYGLLYRQFIFVSWWKKIVIFVHRKMLMLTLEYQLHRRVKLSWLPMTLALIMGGDLTHYFEAMLDLFILPLLVHLGIFFYLLHQILQVSCYWL